MARKPWFKFWVDDYRKSRRIRGLLASAGGDTIRMLAAKGLLLELYCEQWDHGPLPDDPLVVADLLGLNKRAIASLWPITRPCLEDLTPEQVGFKAPLCGSERLLKEALQASEKSEKLSKAAKVKWAKHANASARQNNTSVSVSVSDPLASSDLGSGSDPSVQPPPAIDTVLMPHELPPPPVWGMRHLTAAWTDVLKKSAITADSECLRRLVEAILASAVIGRRDPDMHARALLEAFRAICAARGAWAPMCTWGNFEKYFPSCEQVVSGERTAESFGDAGHQKQRTTGAAPPMESLPFEGARKDEDF